MNENFQHDKPNLKARVQRKYDIQYHDPIKAKSGESVEVGRADNEDPGWLWCRATSGREGWVPARMRSGQGAQAVLLDDYSAKELAVFPGDEVEVETACHGWLLVRNAQGERGWIPQSHIQT
jgi:SH3-like domain-containing protein